VFERVCLRMRLHARKSEREREHAKLRTTHASHAHACMHVYVRAYLSAQGGQGLNEHGGLDGHVQGAHDLGTLQALGGAELRSAGHEARHLGLSHLDLQATEVLHNGCEGNG